MVAWTLPPQLLTKTCPIDLLKAVWPRRVLSWYVLVYVDGQTNHWTTTSLLHLVIADITQNSHTPATLSFSSLTVAEPRPGDQWITFCCLLPPPTPDLFPAVVIVIPLIPLTLNRTAETGVLIDCVLPGLSSFLIPLYPAFSGVSCLSSTAPGKADY